jgi:hypothetical protein
MTKPVQDVIKETAEANKLFQEAWLQFETGTLTDETFPVFTGNQVFHFSVPVNQKRYLTMRDTLRGKH